MKRSLFAILALSAAAAAPAAAQQAAPTRLSVEPYVAYNFFGELPDSGRRLEAAVGYGGRAAFQLSPQWAVFGNYQRSQPELQSTGAVGIALRDATVDQWAGGVEFSFVPRGGAEGMLPVIFEAGLGQTRYDNLGLGLGAESDIAAKLGISSTLQLSRNLGIRYGADDYISNFRDAGIVNQITVRVGAELSF